MGVRKLTALEHLTAAARAAREYAKGLVAQMAEAAAKDIAAVRAVAEAAKTAAQTAQAAADAAKQKAASADKLATARAINGTNFDGTANITTANWGAARNLTIGATAKSVNGSANVSWMLDEIGAAAKSSTQITTQAALDAVTRKSGFYTVSGFLPSGVTDAQPYKFYQMIEMAEYATGHHAQIIIPYGDVQTESYMWFRMHNGSKWLPWRQLLTTAYGNAVSASRAARLDTVTFTVAGDKTKYYPCLITTSGYAWNHINIYRGYADTAPTDWGTDANHKGGLTLCVRWSGDSGWGGNDHTVVVDEFSETYCKMVGGLALSVNGLIVWLRGGSALYRISSENGGTTAVSVKLDTYTASDKRTYAPRAYDAAVVANEVTARWKDRHGTYNGNVTGNAATATKLATARTINGVAFDGSANINVKGFAAQSSAPGNTSLLWIDTTAKTGGLKYHNGSAWVHVPVAYT